MASLYITEYGKTAIGTGGEAIAAPQAPPLVEQTALTIGMTAISSAPFNAATRFIELNCDAACSISFTGAAVATAHRMAANETRFYGVPGGGSISVITNT